MIKTPARHKFSRKASYPIKSQSTVSLKRKVEGNRSSILINHENTHDCFQQQESQIMRQSSPFEQIWQNQKLFRSDSIKDSQIESNIRKSNMKKVPFKAGSQSQNNGIKKALNQSIKFSNLINSVFIQQQEQMKSMKSHKTNNKQISQAQLASSLRTSAIKSKNNQTKFIQTSSFVRDSKTKKLSHFINFHQNLTKKSQHYEDFMRQSNLQSNVQDKDWKQNRPNLQGIQEQQKLQNKILKEVQICQILKQNYKTKISLKDNFFKQGKTSLNQIHSIKTPRQLMKSPRQLMKSPRQLMKSPRQLMKSPRQVIKTENKTKTQERITVDSRLSARQMLSAQQREQLQDLQQSRIKQQELQKQQTEELFRKLQRQIASKAELKRFYKKSNNFYEQLRIKLTKKYDQVLRSYKPEDVDKENIGLLIQGCNLERHKRVDNFYFEKKQFLKLSRPETAGFSQPAKDTNKFSSAYSKTALRPQTSKPKSTQRSRSGVPNQNSAYMAYDNMTAGPGIIKQSLLSVSNKSIKKFSQDNSQSIFCLTNGDIKSQSGLQRQQNPLTQGKMTQKQWKLTLKRQKQSLSTKFDTFLNLCNDQDQQQEQIKKKMEVFQYYCSKVDNGFQKLSSRIKHYIQKL